MVTVEEFLSKIPYKTPHVGSELIDPVRFIEFRRKKTFTASMEFGTEVRAFEKFNATGQDLYFEIIDWNQYVSGTVLSISDPRRKFVLHTVLTNENADAVAAEITTALRKLYRKGTPTW